MTNKFLSVVMMFPLYTSAAIDISNNVTVSDGNSLPVALDVCNPITAQIPGGWLGFKLSTRSPDKCVTSSSGVSSISWNETGEPPRISFTNGMQLLVNESYLNRPGFPGECFICELRLPDHRFRWKHNKLFLLLPEEYGPAFP
ncbi:hypothetical protein ACT3JT_27410, partial [Escherichia coli]